MAALLPGSIHAANGTRIAVSLGALQQLQAAYPLKCGKLKLEGADI